MLIANTIGVPTFLRELSAYWRHSSGIPAAFLRQLSGSFLAAFRQQAGGFPGHVTAVLLVNAIVFFFLGRLTRD